VSESTLVERAILDTSVVIAEASSPSRPRWPSAPSPWPSDLLEVVEV
jgi:hypothetical protein